jgi:uncharacterized protein
MNYLYLHGFASSPQSGKAQFLRTQFAQLGLTLDLPDLNLGNFGKTTLTQQLNFLNSHYGHSPLAVIGSSLGGYLALQMAIANPQIQKIILLAPAFKFSHTFEQGLGAEAIAQWQATGTKEFYHYSFKQNIPLDYEFLIDARTYLDKTLNRKLPILIIHGNHDDVVPPLLSQEFSQEFSYPITLEIVESDHSLSNVMDLIWQRTKIFLQLESN